MIKQIEENLGLTNKNKSIIHNFLFTHNNSASEWGRISVRIYFDFRKRSCVGAAFEIISPISSLSPRFMLRIYILCYGQQRLVVTRGQGNEKPNQHSFCFQSSWHSPKNITRADPRNTHLNVCVPVLNFCW